jgi:hypothetical protein
MDHERIAELNLVERYPMGRLTPEEEELFEEHLLECADCRRQVEWEEDFQGALRTVAAEQPVPAVLPWRPRRTAAPWWLLAAAALLLILPSVWLLRERTKLQGEVARLQAAAERPAVPVPTPAPPIPPEGERQRLAEELKTERDARTRLAEQLAKLTQPQVNTAIFSLGLVRGEDTAARIDLGPGPEWIVLSVELPAEESPSYRATLATAAGHTVWKGEGLKAGADGTVTISLYSTLLEPGGYKLRLEAVDANGRAAPAGEIPFRVARSKS